MNPEAKKKPAVVATGSKSETDKSNVIASVDYIMKLSRASGGASDTNTRIWEPTWPDFCDELSKPEIGAKDGAYYTRGQVTPGIRNDDGMATEIELVIIDAEASYEPKTGESLAYVVNGETLADKWCPYTLEQVSACLTQFDIQHCGYTTHSHQALGEDYNRFRVIIPLEGKARSNWQAAQVWVMGLLATNDIHITTVSEMEKLSIPWYFPRVDAARKDGFRFRRHDGQVLHKFKEVEAPTSESTGTDVDEVLDALQARGLVKRDRGKGYDITCPWIREHSAAVGQDSGAMYFPPSAKNNFLGGFKCHHDHCSERNVADLAAILGVKLPGKARSATSAKSHARADKRHVILPSDHTPYNEAAEDIFGKFADRQSLFYRSNQIVEISEGNITQVKKTDFISRLEILGRTMTFVVYNYELILIPKLCPVSKAEGLMGALAARKLLPSIQMVTDAPVLVEGDEPGSSLMLTKGYHPVKGGIYVRGSGHLEKVSVKKAVKAVLALLDDFAFSGEGDRSRAVALLLTPAIRAGRLLPRQNFPIQLVEANDSQTGKGYLLKLVTGIYQETPAMISQQRGGVGSLDEAISSALATGRPIMQLDNLRGRLDSTTMEMILTAGEAVQVRLPHIGNVTLEVDHLTITVTSNGILGTPDIANRSSLIRLRKQAAGYAFSEFPEGDLLDHVHANSGYYLSCVFAVVAEWIKQGKPKSRETRHDFRGWVKSLDWIVQELMGMAPLMDGHDEVKQRLSSPALDWLRQIALKLEKSEQLGRGMTTDDLIELSEAHGMQPPGYRGRGDPAPILGRSLGAVFNQAPEHTLCIDHFTIQRIEEEKYYENARKTKAVKKYLFQLSSEAENATK